MFGWSREEALGREMAELIVPPSLRESHRRGLARYVKTQQSAKTLAFDPKTKKIFLTAAEYIETPASDPSKRPTRSMKPDSFVVLVVGKPIPASGDPTSPGDVRALRDRVMNSIQALAGQARDATTSSR